MNRTSLLLLPLAGLSFLSGYLMSRASLAGKAGISLFYKEYRFLKVWWQGGLVVLFLLLLVIGLHEIIRRGSRGWKGQLWHGLVLLAAMVGLYYTYIDFRDTLTHRMLGRRFHLGGYLFWVSWALISLFYLWRPGQTSTPVQKTS